MRWIGENTLTYFVTVVAAFAMLVFFSFAGVESLPTALSSPEGEDGLSELAYHFPDQAAEPIILNNTNDSDSSIFRFTNHRFFSFCGSVGSGSASYSSRFQSHSTKISFDTESAILIKLRI